MILQGLVETLQILVGDKFIQVEFLDNIKLMAAVAVVVAACNVAVVVVHSLIYLDVNLMPRSLDTPPVIFAVGLVKYSQWYWLAGKPLYALYESLTFFFKCSVD